jgi:hypothetical protein
MRSRKFIAAGSTCQGFSRADYTELTFNLAGWRSVEIHVGVIGLDTVERIGTMCRTLPRWTTLLADVPAVWPEAM